MATTLNDADLLASLASRVRAELTGDILPFWKKFGRDPASGGFYGFLDNTNVGDPRESRSIVMTARHLWTYSAAAVLLDDKTLLDMADYAYATIGKDFLDRDYGGVFWSVKGDGSPDVSRKQIYGEAFALYGLSAYAVAANKFRTTGAEPIMDSALAIFDLLETKAREPRFGGYVEARNRDWSATKELKLSDKDIDCDKSMNTNLHVMEALTACHRALSIATPARADAIARVGEALSALIQITSGKILGNDFHLDLYFNDDWTRIGDIVSYGHDIEASWLLWEAVEELGDPALAEKIRPVVIGIAETALREGFDSRTGGMENESHDGRKDRTRIWWCQAEALVGFFNAWQLTGDRKFLDAVMGEWNWIEAYQIDRKKGDWFWGVGPDGIPDLSNPKGGNWKASYHNGRCCMEIMNRIAHHT
jgi:cellobiose epimerase